MRLARSGTPSAYEATIAPVQYPTSRSNRKPQTGHASWVEKAEREPAPEAEDHARGRGRDLVGQLGVREQDHDREVRASAEATQAGGGVHRARAKKPDEERRERGRDDDRVEGALDEVHDHRRALDA